MLSGEKVSVSSLLDMLLYLLIAKEDAPLLMRKLLEFYGIRSVGRRLLFFHNGGEYNEQDD
jgi:hypothetical protein